MAKENRAHSDISILNAEDVLVDLRGDQIRISSMKNSHTFSIYISMDEINKIVDKIGKKMMDRTPKRIP